MRAAKYLHVKGMRKPPYENGLVGDGKGAGAPFIRCEVRHRNGTPACIDDLVGFHFALITTAALTGPTADRFRSELNGRILHIGEDLQDPSGSIGRWLEERNATAVLVRPDHYVFSSSDDPETLCTELMEQLQTSRTPTSSMP